MIFYPSNHRHTLKSANARLARPPRSELIFDLPIPRQQDENDGKGSWFWLEYDLAVYLENRRAAYLAKDDPMPDDIDPAVSKVLEKAGKQIAKGNIQKGLEYSDLLRKRKQVPS